MEIAFEIIFFYLVSFHLTYKVTLFCCFYFILISFIYFFIFFSPFSLLPFWQHFRLLHMLFYVTTTLHILCKLYLTYFNSFLTLSFYGHVFIYTNEELLIFLVRKASYELHLFYDDFYHVYYSIINISITNYWINFGFH